MKTELQSLYIRLTNELKQKKEDESNQRKESIENLRDSIKMINKENKRKFN
jgi:hypothetical protein